MISHTTNRKDRAIRILYLLFLPKNTLIDLSQSLHEIEVVLLLNFRVPGKVFQLSNRHGCNISRWSHKNQVLSCTCRRYSIHKEDTKTVFLCKFLSCSYHFLYILGYRCMEVRRCLSKLFRVSFDNPMYMNKIISIHLSLNNIKGPWFLRSYAKILLSVSKFITYKSNADINRYIRISSRSLGPDFWLLRDVSLANMGKPKNDSV